MPIIDYSGLGIARPPQNQNYAGLTLLLAHRVQDVVTPCQAIRPMESGWISNLRKSKQTYWVPQKVPYFNRLAEKFGPTVAIRKFVSRDGSELTLDQLKRRYPL